MIVEDILDIAQDRVIGVLLQNIHTRETSFIHCDGAFIALGSQPQAQLFQSYIATDNNGYIIRDGDSSRTSQEGIFAAGSVADPCYHQAITAAASGCKAAIDAKQWIQAKCEKPLSHGKYLPSFCQNARHTQEN